MTEQNIKNDLKLSAGDYTYALVKGGIGAIPLAGSTAAEIFELLIAPPVSKRRDKWLIYLNEGLQKLIQKVENFQDIFKNETFNTILLHATQAAVRTHQQEKLEALRNAVLNSFQIQDENKTLTFLQVLDQLTVFDLSVLYRIYTTRLIKANIEDNLEELNLNKDISIERVNQVLRTLSSFSLLDENITVDIYPGTSYGKTFHLKNNLGQDFCDFIKFPEVMSADLE